MGISQLTHSVLTDGILLLATVTSGGTVVTEQTSGWFPLLSSAIGASAVLAGVTLTHLFSSRNETKRLTAQNTREDASAKREELKALYTELIRAFDELLRIKGHLKDQQEVIDERSRMRGSVFGQSRADKDYLDKRDALKEQGTLQEANISSILATIDLVGDEMVFAYSYVYFARILKMEPGDTTAVEQVTALKVWMKDVMRASLNGDPLPHPGDRETLNAVKQALGMPATEE